MFGRSLAGLVQFAQRVVRRVFVDVAQGRIVEDRVDEEVNVAAEAQAGQSDVNQLAGELADDVHAEELAAGDSKIILIIPSVSPMIWPRPWLPYLTCAILTPR